MKETAMKTVRCGEDARTAPVPAHRQTACRLLRRKRAAWRRLEAMLEDQRQLYNAALEERIGCHRKTGKGLSYFDRCRALTECRRDIPGMAACPVAVQRGTLKRLDEAFRAFFRRVKAGGAPGFPKFRGRRSFDSFSAVSGVRVRGGRIHLPGLGGMAVRRKGGNPYPDGKPLSAVLKRTGGKRFVTVRHSVHAEGPADSGHAVGVDRNAGQVADSDGVIHAMPDMARLEAKRRRLARKVSRRRKGSRRRERARRQLAKARRKAASRGSQAEFICVACGHAANADVNAAKNIPASGTGASARRGALASATPATREFSTEAA